MAKTGAFTFTPQDEGRPSCERADHVVGGRPDDQYPGRTAPGTVRHYDTGCSMSTTNPPEEIAAADDPVDPVPLRPPTTRSDHRRTRSSGSLIGADLAMVLTMAAVIGLLLGVVGLVELLT